MSEQSTSGGDQSGGKRPDRDETASEKPDFRDGLNADWDAFCAEFAAARDELSSAARRMARQVDENAARAAIKAESLWSEHKVDDRLYGAAGGAKLGFLFGLRGGPKGAALGAAIGGIAGFAGGERVIRNFRQWRDSHKPPQDPDK